MQSNEVQPEITQEEVSQAVRLIAKYHAERNGALLILSGLGGKVHIGGSRFELAELIRWALTDIQKGNESYLNSVFAPVTTEEKKQDENKV